MRESADRQRNGAGNRVRRDEKREKNLVWWETWTYGERLSDESDNATSVRFAIKLWRSMKKWTPVSKTRPDTRYVGDRWIDEQRQRLLFNIIFH